MPYAAHMPHMARTPDRPQIRRAGSLNSSSATHAPEPRLVQELISGQLVSSIGRKHGKSGAQVALKWQVR
jgi:diketogulonate reductase-like aldo/keto reductase